MSFILVLCVSSFAADLPELDQQNVPDRTLILVRHGQYDLKTDKLTDLGNDGLIS